MSGQKTFHLLRVVITTTTPEPEGQLVGLTNSPSWTTLSNILIHLGTTRTNIGESLIRAFNALGSYQSRGRLLEPHQNLYSWALRRYKKGTKAIIKAPTARNHEAVYIHIDQRQTKYKDSSKNTLIFKTSLLFSRNSHIY